MVNDRLTFRDLENTSLGFMCVCFDEELVAESNRYATIQVRGSYFLLLRPILQVDSSVFLNIHNLPISALHPPIPSWYDELVKYPR